jgi:hypothetical protein
MTRRVPDSRIRIIINRIANGDPFHRIVAEENIKEGTLARILRGMRGRKFLVRRRLAEAAQKFIHGDINSDQFEDICRQSITTPPGIRVHASPAPRALPKSEPPLDEATREAILNEMAAEPAGDCT